MSKEQNLLTKKGIEFDERLELKIFIAFLSLFIIPTCIISYSYLYCNKNGTVFYSIAVISIILILIRMFFYTKELDMRDAMAEKYD